MLVGVATGRFLPDTRLLRMRLKLCRKDFFKDLTRDRGPSIASESLGCRVHLGRHRQGDARLARIKKKNVAARLESARPAHLASTALRLW